MIGQHRLTGKEVRPLSSPIEKLFLSQSLDRDLPASAQLRKKSRKLIEAADLICYPPGSFYTSLLANLLPDGVGAAIAANGNPKVFIPNLGPDPEQIGMDLEKMIRRLLEQLRQDNPQGSETRQLLNFVLLDSRHGEYPTPIPRTLLRDLGIELIDIRLVSRQSAPYYDTELLASALMSLT